MSSTNDGGGGPSSSSSSKAQPDKDPLAVLGLTLGASDTDISKAYRQLARTLHPDKLDATADREAAAARFQDIQTARAFLLDPEHAKARDKYYKKQASEQLRRETQAARDAAQSAQRRRMRQELQERETRTRKQSVVIPEALQEEGRKLREHYANQQASAAANERTERQVRLKWSRKQLAAAGEPSPSEDSIAKQLGDMFGAVRDVLMIGSKGNVALVTFAHSASCDAIVERYADSDCWRATYVNEEAKKRYEERKKQQSAPIIRNQRDGESVAAWKDRRAAQRESLLREMENGQEEVLPDKAPPFPPNFPDHYKGSPLDMLEQAEASLLKDLVPPEMLAKISFRNK